MFKSLKIKGLKVSFNIIFILNSIFLAGQNEKQDSYQQFLENVKQIIQKTQKSNFKTQNYNSKFKTERTVRKLKARKQIMGKHSQPLYRFKQQHAVTATSKNPKISKTKLQSNNSLTHQPVNSETLSTINKILRQNSALMPFKFPDLQQFFKKANSQITNVKSDNSLTRNLVNSPTFSNEYMNALREWYLELSKDVIKFWLIFKKNFIDNQRVLKYLKDELCYKEISETNLSYMGIFQTWMYKEEELTIIILSPRYSIFEPLHSSPDGKYMINKDMDRDCYGKTKLDMKKSLCYNLSILNSLGMCVGKLYGDFFECLNGRKVDKCKNIKENAEGIYRLSKKYFLYMSKIFKEKMTPILMDMCYNKCFCSANGDDCMKKTVTIDKNTIYVLLYDTFIKNKLQKVEKLYKLLFDKNIMREYDIIRSLLEENKCKKDGFKKIENNLQKSILNQSLPVHVKNDIEKYFHNNDFVRALDSLKDINIDIFVKVMKSNELQVLLSQFDNVLENLKNNKNICDIIILSSLKESEQEIFYYLMNNNNVGITALLLEYYLYNMQIETTIVKDDSLASILNKLLFLSFDIYKYLSVHKLQKCFNMNGHKIVRKCDKAWEVAVKHSVKIQDICGTRKLYYSDKERMKYDFTHCKISSDKCIPISGEDIQDIEDESEYFLSRYKCIFEDNLNIGCIFNESEKHKIIKEILDKLQIKNLYDIQEKLIKLDGRNLLDFSHTLANKYGSTENLLKCVNYINEGSASTNSLQQVCKNGGDILKTVIEKKYCPTPLKKCICKFGLADCELEDGTKEPQYCYVEFAETSRIIFNNSCAENNDCSKISWNSYLNLFNVWNILEKKQDICKYVIDNLQNCCYIVEKMDGQTLIDKVDEVLKSVPLLKIGILNNETINNMVKGAVGGEYYLLFFKDFEKLKELFKNKDNCN